MIILTVLAIYAAIILLIWAGVNILFNIAELIMAIVKKQKAQIIVHSIQLGIAITLVTLIILFYTYGGN